ncbi:MAG: helix-turn-helix transcriptional regulator [Bacteroidota bacterium]
MEKIKSLATLSATGSAQQSNPTGLERDKQPLQKLIHSILDRLEAVENRDIHSSEWLNLKQLQSFLPERPAKKTIYNWICDGRIPHVKQPHVKAVFFRREEIEAWMGQGRPKVAQFLASRVEMPCKSSKSKHQTKGGIKQ